MQLGIFRAFGHFRGLGVYKLPTTTRSRFSCVLRGIFVLRALHLHVTFFVIISLRNLRSRSWASPSAPKVAAIVPATHLCRNPHERLLPKVAGGPGQHKRIHPKASPALVPILQAHGRLRKDSVGTGGHPRRYHFTHQRSMAFGSPSLGGSDPQQ